MKSIFIIISVYFGQAFALYNGDKCILETTKETGKCVDIHSCESAKRLLQANKIPQNCGFEGNVPLVCCPVHKPQQTLQRISDKQCKKYHEKGFQISVHNGEKAIPKEFTHMAALGYGDSSNKIWLCGGSLISNYFILTAAHCIISREFGPVKFVRLGDLDLQNTTEDARPVDYNIAQTLLHPQHKPNAHYHDIALIKLAREVNFDPYTRPACLYLQNELPKIKLQATGWGKTDFLESSSSHLLKVSLDVYNHMTCVKNYASVSGTRKLLNGIDEKTQFCAGDVGGKDTCPGDSGGPLQMERMEANLVRHYLIVGITSFGKACGIEKSAGVYTRVSAYLDWIEANVWP